MSKFTKKKGNELPPISTASLPDIVFMLLFFFMVVTVMRKTNMLVQQKFPKADQVEKLKKDRSIFIFAGKPSEQFKKYGKEGKIQISDKYTDVSNLAFALEGERAKLLPELQNSVVVALKIDKETNTGLVSDIKEELRHLNMVKIIYITTPGNQLDQ